MAIDVSKERLVPLNAASQFLPNGFRPSYTTWFRWWKCGVRGHKLETVLVLNRRLTSAEAVGRFIAATSAAPTEAGPAKPQRSKDHRAREQTRRGLREAGLLSEPPAATTWIGHGP